MSTYQTPGVYYERTDYVAPAISAIRTDVAAFVGIAERGPVDMPVPVQSWRQFQSHFGAFIGCGFLAYAVRGFFENGGRRCWVVRVASRDTARSAEVTVKSPSGKDVWRIAASSPGVWGNDLSITLTETHRAQATTDPKKNDPNSSVVSSIAGFVRATHVRLRQGVTTLWRVVSDVDAGEKRLIWIHEKPGAELPYDAPLSGFDLNKPILIESVEYTLVVGEAGRMIALYEGLSLVPEHESYGPRLLSPWKFPNDSEAQRKIPAAPQYVMIEELRSIKELQKTSPMEIEPLSFGSAVTRLTGGGDGLTLLRPYDFIGGEISPLDSDDLKKQKKRGIRALDLVDEVSIVAVPDIHIEPIRLPSRAPRKPCEPDPCFLPETLPPAPPSLPAEMELPPKFTEADIYLVQAALVQHCEQRRDRIALLDPPLKISKNDELGVGAVQAWRSRFDSKFAAFYYPWLRVIDPLRPSYALTRDIPPAGHIAGQYARTDFEVGVHKAPANSPLVWIQDVTVSVNDAVHGILNPLGINVIRSLPGRGIRIFGARTVSSDQDWRYLNVRRLLMMIEKAVDLSSKWAIFEPNDAYTRAKLRLALLSFMAALWQKGALVGDVLEDACYVKCDEENNPSPERGNGRLLAEIGIAPSVPMEFIVLRVGRANDEIEIIESSPADIGGI